MATLSNLLKANAEIGRFGRTTVLIATVLGAMFTLTGCVGLTGAKTNSASETSSSTGQSFSMSGKLSPTVGGAGAMVRITGAASQAAAADSSGNFSFSSIPNGSYTVTPSNTGYAFRPAAMNVTVNGANVSAISFTATADPTTFTISGSAGTPGATVTLSGAASASTTADGSGNFVFSGMSSGAYIVTPSKTGFTFSPASQNVNVSGANTTVPGFTASAVPQTFSISGTISGSGGNGATVALSGTSSATTTANASGSYTFTGMANGSYTVTASHAGFTFSPASQSATVSGANVTVPGFTATAQTFSISGTISGSGGNGATVALSGTSSATTIANASGSYTFTGLANGAYTVTPSHTGFTFSPTSQNATVSSANATIPAFTATAVPPQTFTISGTISGSGGNGATVALSGTSSATTTASASGSYSFSGLANGSYSVTPSHTGFTFSPTSQNATVTSANVTVPAFTATAVPPQTFTISGTISGSGGNGATVALSGTSSATTTANASGSYSFAGLSNGAYTVTPSHTGFTFSPTSQNATVSSANVTVPAFTATAVPPQTFTISGTISGSGGNGATVSLSGTSSATTTANASGSYSFAGLSNGAYTVTASQSGFTFSPASQNATVASANVTVAAFTATAQTFSISGTISGSGGNGATVALSGTASATTTANASGNYSFSGLANGSYTVTPSHGGFTFSPASQNATVAGANVTVAAFTATAQTFSISGTISGSGGNGATVALSGTSSATTTANASGNYTFSGLANGSYTVTPTHSGFTFSPTSQNATIASGNVTVPAFTATAQTFSISGTISGSGGNGATVALSGTATASTTANTSGSYTFTGLSNGTYTVTPGHSGFSFSPTVQSVTVSGANVAVPAFTATTSSPTFTISGTISGAGANGTTVTLSGAAVASTTSNTSGAFSFTGLANGSYTVTPSSASVTFSPTFQNVTISGANGSVSFTGTSGGSTNGPAGPWTYTGGDEFNGTSVNTAMWGTQYSWGCTNNDELEGYEPGNVTEGNGLLTLTATKVSNSCSGGKSYSSGIIQSDGKFSQLYGYFEARIQVPAFQGFWPAFWLMPTNGSWPPELDIIELGESGDFNTARMTLHWNSGGDSYNSMTWSNTGASFGSTMHTFAADWEPGVITWYIDGVQRAQQTANIPTIPMYVLANLAVGGSYTGGVGGSTPFPSNMTVDYIRVYKKDPNGCYAAIPGPNTTPSATCQ